MSEGPSYRDRLRDFVASGKSGMIYNADHIYNLKTGTSARNGAGFKLLSGQIVKEFVTIWELFDHRTEFETCIDELTQRAIEIHDQVDFTSIVTCTQPTRELVTHIYPKLRDRIGNRFTVAHFGDYPTTPMPPQDGPHFADEAVLILTDVISTGTSLENMAEIIRKQKGRVVSVLAVLLTHPEWIQEQNKHGRPPLAMLAGAGVLLHSLTDYKIKPLDCGEYEEEKLIPIDYFSLLPKYRTQDILGHDPVFDLQQSLSQLESAKAIEFGFFHFDEKSYSYGFEVNRILEHCGETIWQAIGDHVLDSRDDETLGQGEKTVLVTSFKKEDLTFKNFIEDRLRSHGRKTASVVTIRRGVRDTPYLFNLALGSPEQLQLKNKNVLLALATLTTSEKLRSLVALLSASGVNSVRVVCLFNRMGLFTTHFFGSIEKFADLRLDTGPDTAFKFLPIYSLLDLSSEDLDRMQKRMHWMLSQLEGNTKVESFRRIARRMSEYFQPRGHFDELFEAVSYPKNTVPDEDFRLRDGIEVRTHSGRKALLTHNLALHHDFGPLFEELISTRDRRSFIYLYGLLVADLDYLHFNGDLRRLIPKIIQRIRTLRREREDWERAYRKTHNLDENEPEPEVAHEEIFARLNAEIYLLFGLGIIAHQESPKVFDDVDFIELIFAGKSNEEWAEIRWNMWRHFGEERLFFMIAFMLHGLYPEFGKYRIAKNIKANLGQSVGSLKGFFKRFPINEFGHSSQADNSRNQGDETQHQKTLKAQISLARNTLDLMLTECGEHDHQEKHQVIRYLHRQVLRPKEGHNPIFTSMTELLTNLDILLKEQKPLLDHSRVLVTDRILGYLDDALNATAALPIVSQKTNQLFFFTPGFAGQDRFTRAPSEPGFAATAHRLVERLTDIRTRRTVSSRDRDRLREMDAEIRNDFLRSDSPLRMALSSSIVPFKQVLCRALVDAEQRLSTLGYTGALKRQLGEVESWEPADLLVLTDRIQLQETLRNLFLNLRYSFKAHRPVLPKNAVVFSYELDRYPIPPEGLGQDCMIFEMNVKGKPPLREDLERRENTIADQLAKLKDFGSFWEKTNWADDQGFTFRLGFISRAGFPNA